MGQSLSNQADLPPRLFVAVAVLEAWNDEGTVEVRDDSMDLCFMPGKYKLEAAVRLLKTLPAPPTDELAGRVLLSRHIAALGGEVLSDSLVFDEIAFEVEHGYVGSLL